MYTVYRIQILCYEDTHSKKRSAAKVYNKKCHTGIQKNRVVFALFLVLLSHSYNDAIGMRNEIFMICLKMIKPFKHCIPGNAEIGDRRTSPVESKFNRLRPAGLSWKY